MILAFLMSMTGIITMNALESDFTLTSKFHSMTKGVLFQASNPEVALEEFGINPSYSVLANASAYNYYPFILPDNKQLQAGFMEQYDAFEVTMYYMKNPNAFVRMLDLSIKEAVYLRRDFSGNFEMSAGMPKMSQSIMWSFWSFLKQRSMPKTIGFFTLLLVATLFLLRRSDRRTKSKGDGEYPQIMQVLVLMMVAIGISQSIVSIIMSGDAEFGRRTFLLGMAIDMLLYIFISHLLPKINILDDKEAV